ncbi:cytochrome P450 [Amycolatopsis alba]|uniref:Cytochrome P450 n=1 Tax=Amycolatopsis alba DSM 44262 TaxID=1125972 RepID=A0A229S8N3_AMYAL|nr:cytochrome P450 [Amycolatopsis alba]OXM55185.1 cytochrome P450 [Amycolatopsis alba DSM 44262]
MTGAPELAFPLADATALDPDTRFRGLRDEGPVRVRLPFGEPAWLVSSYEDVRTVLGDRRFSRADSLGADEPRVVPMPQRANLILNHDEPEHSRLRGLVAAAFTRPGVRRLETVTEGFVAGLLDRLSAQGPPGDLVSAVAAPLPALVMAELLGVPEEGREDFVGLTGSLLATALATQTAEQTKAAGLRLWAVLGDLVRERRRSPGTGLVADLVRGGVSDEEAVALCATVVIAGHDATTMQLGNFCYQLLTTPGRYEQLVADPALIENAVEELMRYSPLGISTAFPRRVTEDVELGGVLLRAGDYVVVALTAANRDGEVFDRPDELELTRRPNPHLGFGYGLHRCLGAQLALLQLRVVLRALVTRFPGLALAVPVADVRWSPGLLARSAESLPVCW